MIRPASEALKARGYETSAVILLLALAFVLPGALAIIGARASAHADAWLSAYEPVVYLSPAPDQLEQAQALRLEVEAWPTVKAARVRAPNQALEELRARLGAERVQQLGLSEAMMPASVILEPVVPLRGHIDLAARASGLEARDAISAVDVPSPDALRLIEAAEGVVLSALLLSIVFALIAAVLLGAFLTRMRQDESREFELLEMFGASRASLTRPTMMRGAFLGVVSGLFAAITLLVCQLVIARWAELLTGTEATSLWTWLVVIAPLVLSPTLGVMMGRFSARSIGGLRRKEVVPGVRPALVFGDANLAAAR